MIARAGLLVVAGVLATALLWRPHGGLLGWDEVDYVNAARLGAWTNGLERGSMTPAADGGHVYQDYLGITVAGDGRSLLRREAGAYRALDRADVAGRVVLIQAVRAEFLAGSPEEPCSRGAGARTGPTSGYTIAEPRRGGQEACAGSPAWSM